MTEQILKGLNDKQQEAVKTLNGPVLVLSGPGSGKTRCLTHRIAYLIASGIPGAGVLAVTFTNKAAGEMKERVAKLIGQDPWQIRGGAPTVGTFHSLGVRILRTEIEKLGYGENFSIFDTGDQLSLMRSVLTEMGLDKKQYPPGVMLSKISKLKTDLVSPEDYNPSGHVPKITASVYHAYQDALKKTNGTDFDDLIGLPVKIFRKYPEILKIHQEKWTHILVDEYQDTSHDQYTLIMMLAKKHKNIFCIGDDAQAIYRFREADIRNILNFQKDYPEGKVFFLEQNYRSTKSILTAAQSVIDNNKMQVPKSLWTNNGKGERVKVFEAADERGEASLVVKTMQKLLRNGYKPDDLAILYRTHAQSRAIEEEMLKEKFPYRIVGGVRFYERREIKDILAYIRLVANHNDRASFSRAITAPPRGIGKNTVQMILSRTSEYDSLPQTALGISKSGAIRRRKAVEQFISLLGSIRTYAEKHTVTEIARLIIKKTHYEEHIRAICSTDNEADARLDNLRELYTVTRPYDKLGKDALGKFLEDVALIQETDTIQGEKRGATLMTMHSSKGLEFSVVFIVGMEEGLFPHERSTFEPAQLEEERRLCYVALTRAKEKAFFTLARFRRIFGTVQANLPSRFLGEIPTNVIDFNFLDKFPKNEEDDIVNY